MWSFLSDSKVLFSHTRSFPGLSSSSNPVNISLIDFLCSYEPELFPGLIYRMVKPRIVLLIFVSGKVVLTGNLIFIILNIIFNLSFQELKSDLKLMKHSKAFIRFWKDTRNEVKLFSFIIFWTKLFSFYKLIWFCSRIEIEKIFFDNVNMEFHILFLSKFHFCFLNTFSFQFRWLQNSVLTSYKLVWFHIS